MGGGDTLARVLRATLSDMSADALAEFVRDQLADGDAVVQVAGEFELLYSGRAASVAEAGDYLLLIKPDGSVQVHSQRSVKPVNWQPQTDSLTTIVEDGVAVLYAERFQPAELLRVAFLSPFMAQSLVLPNEGDFMLVGSEAEMQRALAAAPELIEEGLSVIEMELPTDVGGIDLLARDLEGRVVVVELKRGKANHEAVHQLGRYVQSVRRLAAGEVRGILAAPSITAPALNRLGEMGLEFRAVAALDSERGRPVDQPGLF